MSTQREDAFDDLDAYTARYPEADQDELAAAELAIDLAVLLHRVREERGITQGTLARRAGLSQQAIRKIERPHGNITLETLRRYLGALGYALELTVKEPETGKVVETMSLSPRAVLYENGADRN